MTTRRPPTPNGFTVIELLIVIAIIGLLVSLSIPAIQASREASRRMQCTNNVRQFGVAFLNFESQNRVYPASSTLWIKGPLMGDPDLRMHNYMVDLLPFIDERAVSNLYHADAMFCAPENSAAIATPLSVAVCPSAPDRGPAPLSNFIPSLLFSRSTREHRIFGPILAKADQKFSRTYRGAITDYSVPIQTDDGLARSLGYKLPGKARAGLPSMFPSSLFQEDSVLVPMFLGIMSSSNEAEFSVRFRAAQITDGTSHTFMLTEIAGRPERWQMDVRTQLAEPLTSAWSDPWTSFRIVGLPTPSNPQCVIQCDNDGGIYSFHPGGVNFLFADGHVDFLSTDTDTRVIVALMTPNQGDNTGSQ